MKAIKYKQLELPQELACKFTKRPSECSPLPVGVLEEDFVSDSESSTQIPVERKPKNIKLCKKPYAYSKLCSASHTHNEYSNRALLLKSILIPVEEVVPVLNSGNIMHDREFAKQIKNARQERNVALELAQMYRDLAEKIQQDKRKIQDELETRVETVRDFWRNKIIEGESRGGQILRAALFRNKS